MISKKGAHSSAIFTISKIYLRKSGRELALQKTLPIGPSHDSPAGKGQTTCFGVNASTLDNIR